MLAEAPKVKRHEMRIMNESDIHILLEYAKDTPYYALFYTALFTGMRRSELLALRWSDRLALMPVIGYTHDSPATRRQDYIRPARNRQE